MIIPKYCTDCRFYTELIESNYNEIEGYECMCGVLNKSWLLGKSRRWDFDRHPDCPLELLKNTPQHEYPLLLGMSKGLDRLLEKLLKGERIEATRSY